MKEGKTERKMSPAIVIIPIGLALGGAAALALAAAAKAPPPEPEPGLATLYGRVTDAATGKNLSGVYVGLWNSAGVELLADAITNGQGNYSIKNNLPGNYIVQFSKDGYETLVR